MTTFSAMSAVYSDQQATPIAKVDAIKKGGVVRSAYGFLTVIATTAAQTNGIMRIPARARIISLRAENATMGSGALDLDLYRTNGTRITSAGAGLLADFLLSGHSLEADVDIGLSEANAASDLQTLHATAVGTAGATNDVEYDLVGVVITVSTGTAVPVGFAVTYVLPE